MATWILIIALFPGATTGGISSQQVAGFKSEQACEQAAAKVVRAMALTFEGSTRKYSFPTTVCIEVPAK